jgi:hypothetical protein
MYRYGRLSPRNKPAKARTVEDGLRAVGQEYARLGARTRAMMHTEVYIFGSNARARRIRKMMLRRNA